MNFRTSSLGGFALLLLSGCVTFERSYPERKYYALEVNFPTLQLVSNPTTPNDAVLQVASLRISPRYETRSFIYRISDVGYESDFYHQFVASPAGMITEAVRLGLERANIFKNVVTPASIQPPTYVLEGTIHTLYGDFRNPGAGQAAVEIEFILRKQIAPDPGIVLQKRYSRTVPLSTRSPEALIRCWDQAVSDIVTELARDLKGIGWLTTEGPDNMEKR